MISAKDALLLPTARLSDETKAAVERVEALIEDSVRKGMGRNGIDLDIGTTNKDIIAEVNQRLRQAGWSTQWEPIVETSQFDTKMQHHKGYRLSMFPTDESYREADRALAH